MPAGLVTAWLLASALLSEPPPQCPGPGRMEERAARLQAQMRRLERELEEAAMASGKDQQQEEEEEEEEKGDWRRWSALPLAGLLLLLLVLWACPRAVRLAGGVGSVPQAPPAPLPDPQALACFYERSVRLPADEVSRTRELVEGFADDLLEAVRSVCDRELDMELEESIGVGSLYENWRLDRPLACDLLVPFSPPEPYRFQADLLPPASYRPECPAYGTVRVLVPGPDACLCGDTQQARDMLCLVHGQQGLVCCPDLLWAPTAPFLSWSSVMCWFQAALTKAWARISHKYDFELCFQDLECPGSLRIRFRSSKAVLFHLCPVVQFDGSDMYLIPGRGLPRPDWDTGRGLPGPDQDTAWTLSSAVYEKRFLAWAAKRLPSGPCHLACLQVAAFLHQKQCQLSGPSGLCQYHLKTALLHLLARLPPEAWHRSCLRARLHDLLAFLQRALQAGRLDHFILGSRLALPELGVPACLHSAQPPNLLAGLAAHSQLLGRAQHTLAEMRRNAAALVREYGPHEPQVP